MKRSESSPDSVNAVLAADLADGHAYIAAHPELIECVVVTPRSLNRLRPARVAAFVTTPDFIATLDADQSRQALRHLSLHVQVGIRRGRI